MDFCFRKMPVRDLLKGLGIELFERWETIPKLGAIILED